MLPGRADENVTIEPSAVINGRELNAGELIALRCVAGPERSERRWPASAVEVRSTKSAGTIRVEVNCPAIGRDAGSGRLTNTNAGVRSPAYEGLRPSIDALVNSSVGRIDIPAGEKHDLVAANLIEGHTFIEPAWGIDVGSQADWVGPDPADALGYIQIIGRVLAIAAKK